MKSNIVFLRAIIVISLFWQLIPLYSQSINDVIVGKKVPQWLLDSSEKRSRTTIMHSPSDAQPAFTATIDGVVYNYIVHDIQDYAGNRVPNTSSIVVFITTNDKKDQSPNGIHTEMSCLIKIFFKHWIR